MPSLPTSSLLAVRNLGRRHPGTGGWLFRQIDLDVRSGERLAMVGPTGSGKSLILRAIALLDPVDQGEISWHEKPVADASVPKYRGQVLYLQQQSPVIEGSVADNLRIPFSLHIREGSPFPRQQASELLESLGKGEDFLASRTTNLSGGERQIVALLRALLAAPTVLLLDEPSAALDPRATSTLERLIASWHAGAPTERAYIWVSHDSAQAQRVADRILHLRDGNIEHAQ